VRTAGPETILKTPCGDTHVQYAFNANTPSATPFHTIRLTTSPPPTHRQKLQARCKRLRKLVALLLPSAWLMWFYHRRTSVCLAPPPEETYSDDPNVIFVGLAPLGPPGTRHKPVATSAALDFGLGWRSFDAVALREVSLTTFMYLCALYWTVVKLCDRLKNWS